MNEKDVILPHSGGSKGEQTRAIILSSSLELVSNIGLASISFGSVAKASQLSRSGVTGHFKDKETLQVSILEFAESLFIEYVLKKSYCEAPLHNLQNLASNWLGWICRLGVSDSNSCPFIKATIEYQNRPDCAIKSFMRQQQQKLLDYLGELCQRCVQGNIFSLTTDIKLFAYQLYSIYVGHNIQCILSDSQVNDQHYHESVRQLIHNNLKS